MSRGFVRFQLQVRTWQDGRDMILEQFYLHCLAHASYLIGDEETGAAAVIDPQRDIRSRFWFTTWRRTSKIRVLC